MSRRVGQVKPRGRQSSRIEASVDHIASRSLLHAVGGWTRKRLGKGLFYLGLGSASFLGVFFLASTRPRPGEPSGKSTQTVVGLRSDSYTSFESSAPPGMVWIPPGEFTMGTDDPAAWPDERPAHRVGLDGFWMDRREVTNAEFRRFVEATSYVTTAEQPIDVEQILRQSPPGTPRPPAESLVPGSLVFSPPDHPVELNDPSQWWRWTPKASWRHPEGPESTIEGRDDHPVVQVSWDDASAFARWAGKRLPTEAEWERAARGGLDSKPYVWGDALPSKDAAVANLWQGHFPVKNTLDDGYARTAPVGSFPANGFGLHDMAGNVWEWCADWYQRDLYRARKGGVGPGGSSPTRNPAGPERSQDPRQPFTPQRVQRGGSFLCNDGYCSRYRPSARHGGAPDTGMSHLGFRCVKTPDPAQGPPPNEPTS